MLLIMLKINTVIIAKYEQNDAFVKFDYKNDRLDSFLSNFLTTNDFKDIWHI